MKKQSHLSFLLLSLLPLLLLAQNKGIQFEHGLTWKQVQAKAKAEGKYIFIDFAATWCVPCKRMDKEIYSLDKVGKNMNEKFISLKLQIDTTNHDDEEVKNWYNDAHDLMLQYNVREFPTFLFFSPEGKIVHRDFGYKSEEEFNKLISEASDPQRQYYTLLERYKNGKKDYSKMAYLARKSRMFGDMDLAKIIARDYIDNYLSKLEDDSLFTKTNIEFMSSFIQSSKGRDFSLFYRHGDRIDSLLGWKGRSTQIVDFIITLEEIQPYLWKDNKPIVSKPHWNKIIAAIEKKYGAEYAERTVLTAKVWWYQFKKNWPEYTKNVVKKVDKYGAYGIVPDLDFNLNNLAWDLFQHSSNKKELEKALLWSDSAINLCNNSNKANWMDTKANLLYKLGRVEEAIELENKVVALDPNTKSFQDNLAKMKAGTSTWSVE